MAWGVCAEKLGKADEGLSDYNAAIEMNPKNAKAHFNRAVVYWQRQDWQQVVGELQQALQIDPNYKEAAYYLNMLQQKIQKKL